jgi:uncharacterized membrane protein
MYKSDAMETVDVPPGWDHNPSAWSHRRWVVGLALVGAGIALYLTMYQAGLIRHVWEPTFGNGSETVLHSWVSHTLPVPDASLGAIAYLAEAVLGSMGGSSRWRTRPWIVFALGVAVCVFGVTSLLLAIAQPLLFRAWCTLCLTSTAISLTLVGPAADEALAAAQLLERVGAEGGSCWRAFWGLPPAADRDGPTASPQVAS